MKQLNAGLLLLLGVVLLSGCASDFQSTGSGSASPSDAVTYNDSSSTSGGVSQEAIDSQTATDESNAAAQASYVADMAATQQAISNDSN
jgi:uncharacterized protein YceK